MTLKGDPFTAPENNENGAGAAFLSSARYADGRQAAIQSRLTRERHTSVTRILVAILEEARAMAYGTVVVCRDGRFGMKRLFRSGVTDHVLHKGMGSLSGSWDKTVRVAP